VIGAVNGAGTTSEPHNYNFIDYSVVPGVAYTYVLADIDYANVENKYENDAVTITIANDIIEAGFMVGAAYPNPFNPRININFQLSAANHVEAYIYNTKGTLVEELLNCEMMIGSHELAWNATNKPSGIYILKMISGNIVNSQKVILIK